MSAPARLARLLPTRVTLSARGLPAGRLAARVARLLQGNLARRGHEGGSTSVLVTHAREVQLSGAKWEEKMYHRHTGWPGGLKSVAARVRLGGGEGGDGRR